MISPLYRLTVNCYVAGMTTQTSTEPVDVLLDEIRERASRRVTVPLAGPAALRGAIESAGDVPALLAAVAAALNVARRLEGVASSDAVSPAAAARDAGTQVRHAVVRALLGGAV